MSAIRFVPFFKSTSTATAPAIRSISSTARLQKGPVEAAKDTLKKADRAVSGAAVKGIDKGEQARDKVKDAMHTSSGEAQSKMKSMEGDAEKAAGEVKGKTHEAMGEMKGKAKEAKHNTVG